jgi:2-(1,2-epoxy-1,2-dihydrophenyl)acetyl-CoA isomerase
MTIRTSHDDGVLRLVIDRPEKRNALDDGMVAELIQAIEGAGQDESVRVIVLSGAGPDFCTGFDIVGRNASAAGARPRVGSIQRRLPYQGNRLILTMASVQTPIVCVVRGWTVGLGLHLVLASDFAVAAHTARFWEPFNERGFTPDTGGSWLLLRRVGERMAREMLLLGRQLDGHEAAACGLVHAAHQEDGLDEQADRLVQKLRSGPTVALGLTKWLLHAGASTSLEAHLTNEALAMELSSRSEDFKEGMTAFAQRRKPDFRGR